MENFVFLDVRSIKRSSSIPYWSMICLAYPRNSRPSCVIVMPRLERTKIGVPSSFSSSLMVLDREGCVINSLWAASFMLPQSAIVMA